MTTDAGSGSGTSFLGPPDETAAVQRLYADDVDGDGYVMNLTRVWAHDVEAHDAFVAVLGRAAETAGLTFRQRAVLVGAMASELGDSYCTLAWGSRLAGEVGAEPAAGVLRGDDAGLTQEEAVLAGWARQLVRDPNGTTPADVERLRSIGLDDRAVFGVTLFVALRLTFSTVNDALGARPDAELVAAAPAEVSGAVTYGRPPARS